VVLNRRQPVKSSPSSGSRLGKLNRVDFGDDEVLLELLKSLSEDNPGTEASTESSGIEQTIFGVTL
jgi:hypothetical protein